MEKVVFIDGTVAYDHKFEDTIFKMCPTATVVLLVNLCEDNLKNYLENNPDTEFVLVTTSGEFGFEYDNRTLHYNPAIDNINDVCRRIANIFKS